MTVADGVIDALVESELQLRERVASLEADTDAYRFVIRQLLSMLHLVITDPDGWARQDRQDRETWTALTRACVQEMFALEDCPKESPAACR